jgi:hypothetical protein
VGQKAYTNKILKEFKMAEAQGVSTPAVAWKAITIQTSVVRFCILGMWAEKHPDIAFAVNATARVMDTPPEKSWNEVKLSFLYLLSTANYGLRYSRRFGELTVFTEADFRRDKVNLRSTTGVMAIFVDVAVSWTSRLQFTTAFSTEAEIIATSEGAK